MLVLKCFYYLSRATPTKGTGKERLGQRGKWTWLKILPWSDSNLCCQDIRRFGSHKSTAVAQFTHKHHLGISNGSLIPKKLLGSASWPEVTEVARSCQNSTKGSLVHFSLQSQQRVARWANATQYCSLSVGLYLQLFQTLHILSIIHSSKTSCVPF